MISFLTFAYNEEEFIEENIKSIIAIQDNIEYIMVDDKSTDSTYSIMKNYEEIDDRIRVFKNRKKGKNAALNFGIEKCKGDWIIIIGSDDIYETKNYEIFRNEMKKYNPLKSKIFIGGLVKRFTDDKDYLLENEIINSFPKCNEKRSCTNGFASRKIVNEIYPIPEEYPNEDSWTSMCYYYLCDKIVNISQICINYRIHKNNSLNHNDKNFSVYSKALHLRSNQQIDFINKYKTMLTEDDKEYLVNQYLAENYRYNKRYIKLLLCDINFIEKVKLILNSNKTFKKVKYMMTKYAQQKVKK